MPMSLFFLLELAFRALALEAREETRDFGSLKLVSRIFCYKDFIAEPFKFSNWLNCMVCLSISLENGLALSFESEP